MSFDEWLQFGVEAGWCGPPVCDIHDGTPMSEEEAEELLDGYEPCLHVLRLYENAEQKLEIEDAHAPSVWRWSNWLAESQRQGT